jgi:hypothetical protein
MHDTSARSCGEESSHPSDRIEPPDARNAFQLALATIDKLDS